MYCPNCGKQIPDDSMFCPECGANISTDNSSEEVLDEKKTEDIKVETSSFNKENKNSKAKKGIKPIFFVAAGIVLLLIGIKMFVPNNDASLSESTESVDNSSTQSTISSKQQENDVTTEVSTNVEQKVEENLDNSTTVIDNQISSKEYAEAELAESEKKEDIVAAAVMEYYKKQYGQAPPYYEAVDNGDGTVWVRIYEIVDDHTATWGSYTISLDSYIGEDDIMLDTIDFSPYINQGQKNGQQESNSNNGTSEKQETTSTNDGSDYILPESDRRLYSKAELEKLTTEELRYARNEIIARHGRRFKDENLQNYFDSKEWYSAIYDPSEFDAIMESLLNDVEKENIETIKQLEKNR